MLSHFIYTLHPTTLIALVLAGTLAVSSLCVFFCRYFLKTAYSDDIAFKIETYSDAFGIAFAILLGLIITSAWNTYDQTADLVREEVSYLNDIFRLSSSLESAEKAEIRQNLRIYVHHVIDGEWPLLPQGKHSETADGYLFKTINNFYKHESNNKDEKFVRSEIKRIMPLLSDKRKSRVLNAHSSLTPIVWIILVSCNLIAFFILGLASTQGPFTFQVLLQSLYATGIGLMLLLVIIIDRPFYFGIYYGGEISSDNFKTLLDDWEENENTPSTNVNIPGGESNLIIKDELQPVRMVP